MKSDLISTLAAVNYPLIELAAPNGTLLILPHGARVLGLFNSSGDNFFWVNPALTNVSSANALFSSTSWKNSGGDRTWVAPEADLFIKNINDPWNIYEVPASIDPGNYTVRKDDGQVRMMNQARLLSIVLRKNATLNWRRQFGPLLIHYTAKKKLRNFSLNLNILVMSR